MRFCRQRADCLSRLGLQERAVSDMDQVIRCHGDGEDAAARAEDLCRRGRGLVLLSREGAGLEDFARALELARDWALRCVEAGLGRRRLADCFLRGALQRYGEGQLGAAWRLVESGLNFDPGHVELRRLRARVKREVSGSCIVH